MKSNKNEELNFLYLDDKYNGSQNKTKKNVSNNKKAKKTKKIEAENELFDFDNEIVIGVTKVPSKTEEKRKATSKSKNNSKAPKKVENQAKKKGADDKSAPRNIGKKVTKTKKRNKKSNFIKNIIKWTILLSALVAAFVFFLMSPLFNVTQIDVKGNGFISNETIISLSEIKIGENIYKTSKAKIEEKIKQNTYVESVQIKRILPNKIEIDIKERKTTYMLQYANSFAYINNQGYILEISEQRLDNPIITGFTTNEEYIQAGSRLNEEDLKRLETVLKIIDSINANGITNKISRIDIANKHNYVIYMDEDKKTVYIGDGSNLSSRMLYLKAALEDVKGLEGEIFVNGDLVKEKAFFRQKE